MLPYPQHHLLGQGRNTLARKALAISRTRRRLGNQHLYFDFDVQHYLRLYQQQQYQDIVLPPCYCRSSAPCNSFARHRAYAQRLRDCQHQQHNPGIETTNRQAHRLYAISPRRLHRRSVARTCRGKPMTQISSVGFLRSDTFPGPRHCRCTQWSHRLPLGKVSRTPLTGH